jgi:hypothetical protein
LLILVEAACKPLQETAIKRSDNYQMVTVATNTLTCLDISLTPILVDKAKCHAGSSRISSTSAPWFNCTACLLGTFQLNDET